MPLAWLASCMRQQRGASAASGGESDEGSRSSSAGGGALRHPQTPHAETPPHVNGAMQTALAREYLALQAAYPSDLRSVKQHLFALLYANVQVHTVRSARLHACMLSDSFIACRCTPICATSSTRHAPSMR